MNVDVTEAFKMRGCRKLVFRLASTNLGYYSTDEHVESIMYDGTTLAILIAFTSRDMGRRFYNEFKSWDGIAGVTVVQPLSMQLYSGRFPDDAMIFEADYDPSDFDSPEGSRISVQSSIQDLPISSGVSQHQSIQPLRYANGGGFDRCHIKSKKNCRTNDEKKDDNNIFAFTKGLHAMYDGPPFGVPRLVIRVEQVHAQPVRVHTEGKGWEYRYKVDLRLEFREREHADGYEGVFKDGTES